MFVMRDDLKELWQMGCFELLLVIGNTFPCVHRRVSNCYRTGVLPPVPRIAYEQYSRRYPSRVVLRTRKEAREGFAKVKGLRGRAGVPSPPSSRQVLGGY